jgi:hypothetical protein
LFSRSTSDPALDHRQAAGALCFGKGKLRHGTGSGEATDLHPGAFALTNVN